MGSPNALKPGYHHGDLRKALLSAAEKELAEQGVERFSLRRCAKRAGVSHAAPAHHFADANALLTALAAEGFARFVQAMRARQEKTTTDPEAKLIAAGLGYIDFATANPALFRLMFASNRPDFTDSELKTVADAAFSVLLDAIRDARGEDAASPATLRRAAAAWAQVHGLADLVIAGRLKGLQPIEGESWDDVYAGILAGSGMLGRD